MMWSAADGELELPEFTLRWTNFENVQIAYEEEAAEIGTEGETEPTAEATPEATDEAG